MNDSILHCQGPTVVVGRPCRVHISFQLRCQPQAMHTLVSVKDTINGWLDEDVISSLLQEAQELYMRARSTKCEVLCARTLRDSRKKADHLLKYVTSFSTETESDWQDVMFGPLKAKVVEILFPDEAK